MNITNETWDALRAFIENAYKALVNLLAYFDAWPLS